MYLRTSKNQPCPCGSGKKYKKCCLEKDQNSDELKEIYKKQELELKEKLDKINRRKVARRRENFNKNMYAPFKNISVIQEDLLEPSHNLFDGRKLFVLGRLEQLIYELRKAKPSDRIIQYLSAQIYFLPDRGNLTKTEYKLAKTPTSGNLSEYLQLVDGAKPDYSAMRLMTEFAYQAILEGISDEHNYWSATISVDTNDTLVGWEFDSSDEEILTDQIFVHWKSLDTLENEYKILINKLFSFEEESLKTLATTTAQMKNMNQKSTQLISYTCITIGFLGVLEQELSKIVMIHKKVKQKRMMLREICTYLKDKNIGELDNNLIKRFKSLIPLRNKAAHGEFVSKEEFMVAKEILLTGQGFEFIAWTKSDLMKSKQTTL